MGMNTTPPDAGPASPVAGTSKGDVPAALIALGDPSQRQLWEHQLAAQGLTAHLQPAGVPLDALTLQNPWLPARTLLVLGADAPGASPFDLPAFLRALAADPRTLRIIVSLPRRLEVSPAERALLLGAGAGAVVPRIVRGSAGGVDEARSALRAVLPGADEQALRAALARAPRSALPDPCDVFIARGVDPLALIARMRAPDGLRRETRRHGLHSYPDCFVGREAVDWLAHEAGLSREDAVIGGEVLRILGVFDHVVKDQPFRDGRFFYRFAQSTPKLEALDFADLIDRMRARGGLDIARRTWHRKDYDACFVGAEAVAWLGARCGLSEEEAVLLGQSLVDLGVIHHVVDEHPFVNDQFFYRFRRHEAR